MAKITITNAELITKRQAAQNYINTHPDRTRFHYSLEKFLARTKTLSENFTDDEQDIRVDCALTQGDKVKKFVYEDGNGGKILAVDPEKAKELNRRVRALQRKKVEFESHFATEIPKNLEAAWYYHFIGIVIENDPLEEDIEEEAAVSKKEVPQNTMIEELELKVAE